MSCRSVRPRLDRAERCAHAAGIGVPRQGVVTPGMVAWAAELGVATHITDEEVGELNATLWMARFTWDELIVLQGDYSPWPISESKRD